MPSTYSDLKIQLMATGENNTTWGDITNLNLEALEDAIVGSAEVTFASANVTLTLTDANTPQTARNVRLRCVGTTGGLSRNLVVPSIEKPYIVQNDCADSIVVKTAAGTGVTVPPGRTMWVVSDGANVVDVVTHLSGLTLNVALPVTSGGTGATTAPAARTALGATTLGGNLFTLANPSAVTFPRFNADNTVSALSAADFRTAIGITGGVTSVNASGGTTGLTFSGGPITTSGTLTLGGTLGVANGGTGATTFTANRLVRGNGTGAMTAGGVADFSDTEAIRIDVNENVGIGTTTPTSRLDVRQNSSTPNQSVVRISGDLGAVSAGQALTWQQNGALAAYVSANADSGGSSTELHFGTNAAFGSGAAVTRMVITGSGDVGVGTSSPSARLSVSGNAAVTGALTLGTPLAIISGGTNATNAADARGNLDAATRSQVDQISGFIGTPINKLYRIAIKMVYAGTITETTTRSVSGTCTATFSINGTPLGGAANSVSSSEQSRTHTTANTFVAGDDIEMTVSANSSCVDMSFTIALARTLA